MDAPHGAARPGPVEGSPPAAGGRDTTSPTDHAGWWFLLPVTWTAWLCLAIAPSLLLSHCVATARPWFAAETAPSAVTAAAVLFLVAAWPFWPAFAGRPDGRGISAGWIGLSLVEAAVLAALSAPFALAAWSVGGRAMDFGPAFAALASAAALGLGFRIAWRGLGDGAGRWLIAAALLVCAGPVALAYAAAETLGTTLRPLADFSPLVSAVRLVEDGWPDAGWQRMAALYLGPGVGAALAAAGLLKGRRSPGLP